MRFRRAIKVFLSLYLWGFVAYQITPVRVIPYVNYAPTELSPKPVVYSYSFAYDVKTAFSNHAGSIRNLLEAMEKRRIDVVFGDFPQGIEERLFPMPKENECLIIRKSSVPMIKSALHFLLDTLPKTLAGGRPEELLSRESFKPSVCYVLAHDRRVLFSTFLGLELPSYASILGGGKNIFLSRDVLIRWPYSGDILKGGLVLLGQNKISVFAYSDRSFYLPGERTIYPFRYVVETDLKRPLLLVFRDGDLKGVFNQRRINLSLNERGSYTSQVITYKFKVHILYFGVRTVALASSIGLM